MVIETKGILNFFPPNETKKHNNQSEWKKHALIETDCDLERYYAWFLEKRFSLKLNKTLRGTHISFIADRFSDTEQWDMIAKKYHGKEITFFYEIEPRSNGEHWWLRVHSPDAEDIREELGLSRDPFYALHLTLGHANNKNIEHSCYILEVCMMFDLITSEVRKDLSKHEIVNNFE